MWPRHDKLPMTTMRLIRPRSFVGSVHLCSNHGVPVIQRRSLVAVLPQPAQSSVRSKPGVSLVSRSTELRPSSGGISSKASAQADFVTFSERCRHSLLIANCEPDRALSVAVLLSGGVDSSVALALLKATGHQITAYYLKIWFQEDFENSWGQCPWEDDIRYASQVCEKLDVRFEVIPMTEEYWKRVISKTIAEIKAGRTPNPDVLCNSQIKYGAFLEFLDRQRQKFDRVASGHYARIIRSEHQTEGETIHLAISADTVKDQTYFLSQLTNAQLSKCMFPLGGLKKTDVRRLAVEAGLPTAGRKDSQGICFLGKVRFKEFIERHLGTWPGLILEDGTNQQLGFHNGYWFHTIGQRTGLKLSGGPWFVSKKDIRWNVVYVKHLTAEDTSDEHRSFFCEKIHWNSAPPSHLEIDCKVRHGELMYRCTLERQNEGWGVRLESRDQGLASGQYAVFYQKGICLGSGIIQSKVVIDSSSSSERVTRRRKNR